MTQQVRPEHGALFDFSRRAKLRVTGADRVRFLNGQITNDVRRASAAVAVHACVLNAKGKMHGDVFIHADGDSFLIDSVPELREPLAARLERYVIADDVLITDVTDDFALLHTIGGNVPEIASGSRIVDANRFALPGADLWLPRATYEAALQELSATLPLCDEDCAETFRIERGVPRWGRELSEEIIPPEANLESSAIDYAKGCYIGQEIISRIKMSGQTNKRLCGLACASDAGLSNGMRLVDPTSGTKEVGWITSVASSRRLGKQIALGFVKRGFNDVGSSLRALPVAMPASDDDLSLEVVRLPFAEGTLEPRNR